jgi:hypothetical protein
MLVFQGSMTECKVIVLALQTFTTKLEAMFMNWGKPEPEEGSEEISMSKYNNNNNFY